MENHLVSWQASAGTRKSRPIVSCLPCHQRKVKCGRGQPCDRCSVAGRSSECLYQASKTGSLADDQPRPEFPVLGAFVDGKARLGLTNSWPALCWDFTEARPYLFGLGLEPELQQLYNTIKNLKYLFSPKSSHVCDNTNDSIAVSPQPNSTIERLMRLLSREAIDILILNYMETFDQIIPLWIHKQFDQEISRFWRSPETASSSFIIQLFLMLSLSCHTVVANNTPLSDFDLPVIAKSLFLAATSMLDISQSQGLHDLSHVRALCIIVMAKIMGLDTPGNASDCAIQLGITVRGAQKLALHRHPRHFPGVSPAEGLGRLIVWTSIVFMDQLVSIHSNLPPLIRQAEYDARFQYHDNTLDSKGKWQRTWHQELEKACEKSRMFFITLLSETLTITSVGVEKLASVNPSLGYDEVERLGTRLREFLHTSFSILAGEESQDSVCILMQRGLLEVFIRRVLLGLYQPFVKKTDASCDTNGAQIAVLENSLALIVCQEGLYEATIKEGGTICLLDLLKEDFAIAIIHVSLGLRRCDFSAHSLDTMQESPKEIAWTALKRAIQLTESYAARSVTHFRIHAGAVLLVAMLEALEFGTSIKIKMKEASQSIIELMTKEHANEDNFDGFALNDPARNSAEVGTYPVFENEMDFSPSMNIEDPTMTSPCFFII